MISFLLVYACAVVQRHVLVLSVLIRAVASLSSPMPFLLILLSILLPLLLCVCLSFNIPLPFLC